MILIYCFGRFAILFNFYDTLNNLKKENNIKEKNCCMEYIAVTDFI